MPAIATHYQFGQLVFWSIRGRVAEEIATHKRLFDLGLQGPDILFFFNPLKDNDVDALGHAVHNGTGRSFIEPALETIRNTYTDDAQDAAIAYLAGCVCHFMLDSACHPEVENSITDEYSHNEIEADFDKEILHKYSLSERRQIYIPVANTDYSILAPLYPTLSVEQIKKSATNMRVYAAMLNHPHMVDLGARILKHDESFAQLCLPAAVRKPEIAVRLNRLLVEAVGPTVEAVVDIASEGVLPSELIDRFNLTFGGRKGKSA